MRNIFHEEIEFVFFHKLFQIVIVFCFDQPNAFLIYTHLMYYRCNCVLCIQENIRVSITMIAIVLAHPFVLLFLQITAITCFESNQSITATSAERFL